MQVADGRVIAISDAGVLLRFALPGRGPARVRLDPLPEGPGPATRKSNRDTEAMAVEDGELRVAFEKHNMIWRYRLPDLAPVSAARPPAMRGWRVNAGAEAMVRLADGRYLVFSEGRSDDRPLSDVVLFDGDPSVAGTPAARLSYRRPPGFRITDAALLPNGRLLLLHRRFALFEGISATLAVADPRGVRPGAILEARADRRASGAADRRQYGGAERHPGKRPDDRLDRLGRQFLPAAADLAAEVRFGRMSASFQRKLECHCLEEVRSRLSPGWRWVRPLRSRPASWRSRASGGGP